MFRAIIPNKRIRANQRGPCRVAAKQAAPTQMNTQSLGHEDHTRTTHGIGAASYRIGCDVYADNEMGKAGR